MISFSDNRDYALRRWAEIVEGALESLSTADQPFVMEPRDYNSVQTDLMAGSKEAGIPVVVQRDLSQLVRLVPRTLENLGQDFTQALLPNPVNLYLLWGLLVLNVKVIFETSSGFNQKGLNHGLVSFLKTPQPECRERKTGC